ncbi:MAG: hypothetical protein WCZ23_00890 [Rhodospirillaceae bacterium]
MAKKAAAKKVRATVRCAIYTRKSSEEGLAQEFNSMPSDTGTTEREFRIPFGNLKISIITRS